MSAHTPGRLTVRANGDANSYALLDEKGQWCMSLLLNGRQMTAAQQENMRRLAACWNAFDGISPALLDCIAGNGGVSLILSMASQHAKELNAARADLETARKRDEEWHDHTTRKAFELSEAIFERDAARALLREVHEDGNLDMGDQVASELDNRISAYFDSCDQPGDPA